MAAQQENGDAITAINITPLVDIVLVILIIFMATAHIIANRSIPMSLPKAANTESKPTASVQVALTKDGTFLLNNSNVTHDELILNLGQIYRRRHRRNSFKLLGGKVFDSTNNEA